MPTQEPKSAEAAIKSGLPSVPPDGIEEELGENLDNAVPTAGFHSLPVVGLGGSAGSIDALQTFFSIMPVDSGMAFVVILHLAPDHASTMPELLARFTSMPVVHARDGEKIKSNSVYVIPPGKFLTVGDGHLRLTELEPVSGKRVTVDLFFRALADSHGSRATAIVLSGADGDGALGIKRIKERGGLTIAQDPSEAQHNGMPRSAIETGMVDWVLKVQEMPSRLISYRQNEKRLRLPQEENPRRAPDASEAGDSEPAFRDVLSYVRTRTGHDFSNYKRATIIRRLSRRMQVNGIEDVPSYLVYLRTHPGEAGALLQDLLISVTNFFRDRDAFAALEARIPQLFEGKTSRDAIRVWVPACASGEEAFSVAMLLLEHARTLDDAPVINVFATDLDEGVIQSARAGFYPEAITADVSEDRLRRFFTKEAHGYRVRRDLRETVLFAVQDLLKDSPFSRLDLVSCRNLLIYLNQEAQVRALEIFHFALRAKGFLFLGVSESVGEGRSLFNPIDKKHRLYTQVPSARIRLPVVMGPGPLTRILETPEKSKPGPPLPQQTGSNPAKIPSALLHGLVQNEAERLSWTEVHFKLLELLGPPSIIVNRDYDILHISEKAGHFLQFVGGDANVNLLRVAHPSLRVELRTALYRVTQSKTSLTVYDVPHAVEGAAKLVDITVAATPQLGEEFLLVSFHVRAPVRSEDANHSRQPEPVAEHLERELEQLRSHLNETVEQYEGSTEELKASNEELQAINEELRTATEELETSREELQSVNEELSTVNQELKSKVDEVAHSNSDLHNLMAATAIATIFVDRDLRIVRFTPSALSIFRLISTDIGRPLSDLTHQLLYPDLIKDAESVVRTLAPVEREVSDQSSNWFLARLLPYRTLDDHIEGVVLTFVDITRRKQAEESLRITNERLRLMVENAREFAIFAMDLDRRVTSWNSGGERLLQYQENEIVGRSADILFTPEDRAEHAPEMEARSALADGRAVDERWHQRKDGSRFWGSGFLMTMRTPEGKALGFVKIMHDRTKAKETEDALQQSREQLLLALKETEKARKEAETAGKTKDRFLAILSHELRTPLTPVLMAAESLLRRNDLPKRAMEALQMICRNIEIETHFIDDLLDITKISRGTLEVLRIPLDLHEAIEGAVRITEIRFQAKKQTLSVACDAKEHEVIGDFQRLQQVFWNLLINASKFTPEGGKISVTTRIEDRFIFVDILDNGRGIDPTALPDIFLAFKQGDESVAREYGGLGLGLAISKATVEALGGSIMGASDGPGRGSTFTVKLPLAKSVAEKKAE